MMHRIPPLIRFLLTITICFLTVFTLARLAFWLTFDNPHDPLGLDQLLTAMYIGLKFDLRLTLLILAPMYLLAWIKWINPLTTRFGRLLWGVYLGLISLGAVAFYVTDFGHYAYLMTRVDSTALRFLSNPMISAQMVWESYPVLPWLLGLAALLCLFAILYTRLLRRCAGAAYTPLRLRDRAAMVLILLLMIAGGIYGKLSWYPLRWSDAFFSTHAFAPAVASNPVLYFFDTFKTGALEYDIAAVRDSYPLIAEHLGVDQPDPEDLDFARFVLPVLQPERPQNVIIVLLESFTTYKTGLTRNPLNPSPHFDRLVSESLVFQNFFTPTAGTARSVFTAVTGLPDVQLRSTASRNPTIINQHTIINAFEGYEKFFFLGGSASWGNIRGLLQGNIAGLRLYEEGDYASPRNDVWGISDLALFKEAHAVLEKETGPFLAILLTSGNHRPYTIPADNEGFEIVGDVPQDALTRYGFHSLEEYNSFRFMDHALGHFMDLVKGSAYYEDTVFVFFGDHGHLTEAAVHTYPSEIQLGLAQFRVPLVIHAPALFPQSQILDTVASEMDVLTTVAAITGHAHLNTTLGRNLFDPQFDPDRHAFVMTHGAVPNIGVINDEFYFRMNLDDSGQGLYRIHADDSRPDLSHRYPDQALRMRELTRGLYESTRYIVNHNPHRDHRPVPVD
ncbi:LTA synthase family protein [Desulfonatronum parangueonense]